MFFWLLLQPSLYTDNSQLLCPKITNWAADIFFGSVKGISGLVNRSNNMSLILWPYPFIHHGFYVLLGLTDTPSGKLIDFAM